MDGNLREVLMPIAVMGSMGGAVYAFVKTYSDYALRRKLIDKGMVNAEAQMLFNKQAAGNKYGALKWGLIILAAGLALILMEYIPVGPDSPLPYGLFAVFVSVAYLIYYVIVSKDGKPKD